jgi:glycosyltransferase involved in cell wall biosynthesis
MNVWLVTVGEPLPLGGAEKKMRTAMLAGRLLEKGHAVTLFASAFDHFKKRWLFRKDERLAPGEQFHVEVMKGCGYGRNISVRRMMDHRLLGWKFRRRAASLPAPDVLVASFPPHDLAYEAVRFARRRGIPVIADIRDPWPDLFVQAVPGAFRPLAKLLLSRDFRKTRLALQWADGLVATTGTLLDWGLRYAGREKRAGDRVFYLGQGPRGPAPGDPAGGRQRALYETIRDKFIVFYVGTWSHYHSPLVLLQAAERLAASENIHFVVAGDGPFAGAVRKRAARLPNVTLPGWLQEEEINFWLDHSNAGACPTPKHTDILPNKAGLYLSAGLPVLSAFMGDLKTLIEKRAIGLHFPPGDAGALAAAVSRLATDPPLCRALSANARQVFSEHFDATVVYPEYARWVESAGTRRKKA